MKGTSDFDVTGLGRVLDLIRRNNWTSNYFDDPLYITNLKNCDFAKLVLWEGGIGFRHS